MKSLNYPKETYTYVPIFAHKQDFKLVQNMEKILQVIEGQYKN